MIKKKIGNLLVEKGYINEEQVEKLARPLMNNAYGQYLLNIIKTNVMGTLTLQSSLY